MKAVLLSTAPKWCEKICHEIGKTENGKPIYEKRIEVRKTAPKDVPFKCYIYCTLPPREEIFTHGGIREYAHELIRLIDGQIVYDFGMRVTVDGGKLNRLPDKEEWSKDNFLCQKVIGEFVCNKVEVLFDTNGNPENYKTDILPNILQKTALSYDEFSDYVGSRADKNNIYGWHISDLKIYDKPKELSEFRTPCGGKTCAGCKILVVKNADCVNRGKRYMSHPPQSWCYAEELEG